MTYKGIDLTPFLTGLLTLIAGLISWASLKVSAAADAAKTEKNAAATLAKVGALVLTITGKAWDRLAPVVQKVIADGKVTEEERALVELAVKDVLRDYITEDALGGYASALGLPLPGLIAKIAAMVLSTFTKAHDPDNETESALQYPVDDAANRVSA